MGKMEIKREQKRIAIIEAGQAVFEGEGYMGASMDAIAARAGVTKQTVYRYFPSKEVLFQACLESQRDSEQGEFWDALEQEDTGQALTEFGSAFLDRHLSEEHLARVRLLIAEGHLAPEMTRVHFALGPVRVQARLVTFFKERYETEDPEYVAKAMVSTLLSVRTGVLMHAGEPPSKEALREHVERTVVLVLRLLSDK